MIVWNCGITDNIKKNIQKKIKKMYGCKVPSNKIQAVTHKIQPCSRQWGKKNTLSTSASKCGL